MADTEKNAGEEEQGEDHKPARPRQSETEDDTRADAKPNQNEDDNEGEVAEGRKSKKEEGSDRFDVVHEAGTSLLLTVAVVVVLGLCVLRAGAVEWLHLAVFGLGYAVLFSVCWFLVRRSAGSPPEEARVGKGDIRFVVIVAGFAAAVFGTPAFLEIAPDLLAVAGAVGGMEDGALVGLVSRQAGVSGMRAVRLAVWDEDREEPS